jgi:hypothetical protein
MGARSYIQDRGFLFVVEILLQASILETTPTVITLDFYIKHIAYIKQNKKRLISRFTIV